MSNGRYRSTDKPEYRNGHAVMIALNTLSFLCMSAAGKRFNCSDLGYDFLVEVRE
jgi:hypothetical protein